MPLFSKKITPTNITDDIEKATDSSATELDWALVIKLCESVNSTALGAKEARKLLQKKITSHEPKTQLLALEILKSLSENCTEKMRTQLTAKSFGEDLYNLATSKTIDQKVYNKLVQCLDNWVRLSNGDMHFSAIIKAYNTVMTKANKTQAILQRDRSARESRPPRGPATPEDIKRDIEVARNSAQLFSQTLSFTDPTQEDISENELIQEFRNNCKRAQQLLATHLETCEDSDLLSDLINTNNELLSCFKSYDEMLEQHAVNEATINSQKLHDRSTRNDAQLKQQQHHSEDDNDSAEASSKNPFQADVIATQQHSNPSQPPANSKSSDPFDPFADTNEAGFSSPASATNQNIGTSMLPPPLTPQKMHD